MSDVRMDEEKTFGGCEGPDAMYVKLISSDGHEFIVKRDHALTSGTIKAMLSGPGQFSENETNEINFREIPSHVLQKVHVLYLQSTLHQLIHGNPRISHRAGSCIGITHGRQLSRLLVL